jgi:hypothetical protein
MPAQAGINDLGFWEPERLVQLHEELLASAGSRWDDWREIKPDWYGTPVAAQFKARANQLLDEEFGNAPLFVFKDPRNCRIARFWLDIFAERGIVPKIVLPIRSPLEVAQSHRARDGFPLRKGLLLWLRHVLDAEAASRDLPRVVVEYEVFLKDWQSSVVAMEQVLGAFPGNTDLAVAEVDHFLRGDLKHQRVAPDELARNALVHAWVEQAYAAMLDLVRNPGSNSACAALDDIRDKFNVASALFGGVLADAEASLSEAEQRLREADRTRQEALAQLAATQQERDVQAAEAVRLAAAHAELGHAHQQTLTQLAAVQQERDAQAAEAVVHKCQIEAVRAELSAQQHGAQARHETELRTLAEQRDTLQRQHDETVHRIFQSRSWKLTAPLRKVMSVFK